MNVRCASAVVVVVLGACDPGGSYHVLGGSGEGRQSLVAGNSQTSLRASATWFTTHLTVDLGIANNGTTPLAVRPNELRISDRKGVLSRSEVESGLRCATQDGERVVLAPNETCELHTRFDVKVNRDQLKTLILTHDGVTRDNVAVPISLTFEMD